jgi:hypothetical protein
MFSSLIVAKPHTYMLARAALNGNKAVGIAVSLTYYTSTLFGGPILRAPQSPVLFRLSLVSLLNRQLKISLQSDQTSCRVHRAEPP